MATNLLDRSAAGTLRQGLPDGTEGRVYAIAFDMDVESLRQHYGDPYNGAHLETRRVLERHGFRWQQGSTYFGGPAVNAVLCVMAAMELAAMELGRAFSWFASAVRDVRVLRIEEFNDLMPAVQQAAGSE